MNNDTNLQIRNYFHGLIHDHKIVAKYRASSAVGLLKLSSLDPTQRVRKIVDELDLLKRKRSDFERKEYLDAADDEAHLFNYFSGHLYFSHHNEKEKLLEGLVLSETHHLLSELLLETMAQLPLFPMAGFMNNDPNVVFYELNQQPFGTSDEDYAAMRGYQARMRMDCVDLESNLLIARCIESLNDMTGNLALALAQTEKDRVEFLLANVFFFTPRDFIQDLSHLRAFPPGSMAENAAQWNESFCQFLNGKAMPYSLSPGSLQSAYRTIRAGKIAPAPICIWSLMKYNKWLSEVLEGKIELKKLPERSIEKLLENSLTAAVLKSKAAIAEFIQNNPSKAMIKAEWQAVIFARLHQLLKEFNTIDDPEYYRLIPEPEWLKCCFINNCVLGQDLEQQQAQLEKAVYLDQMIRFFEGELIHIDPKLIRTSFDLEALNLVINDLISIMVPNSQMIDLLKKAFDQAAQWLKNRKPILFIEMDLTDAFCRIFNKAIRLLQQLLDDQPADLKAQYAACQLRNLNYLAINAQKNGQALNQCIDNLRQVFQCEMQYKEHQDQCTQFSIEDFTEKETEAPAMELLSFGYKKSPGYLPPFIRDLNEKVGFLDDRTSVDDFIRIVTSDNLALITDHIYLGCQTNEFKYIIQYLRPFFKSFNPATIGKSGIFISNVGNPITANCLYNTKIDYLQTKFTIDNIFKKKP